MKLSVILLVIISVLAQPSSGAAQSNDYRIYPGMVIDSGCTYLGWYRSDSPRGCIEECRINTKCNALNYKPSGRGCALHGCPYPITDPSQNSAEYDAYILDKGYKIYPGKVIGTGCYELAWYRSDSPRGCIEECRNITTCNAFSYKPKGRGCALRSCGYPIDEPNQDNTDYDAYVLDKVPSCSLVWRNHEEHRPLIMIRESRTIIPPITDRDISEDPNRIPSEVKLIFACPGDNNQFIHVNSANETHTKLHGECVSTGLFKVCVNNNPEIFTLNQLSCSRRISPSFIKSNDSSEKRCDDNEGELYKTGYTYGNYYEFKDLEIDVCFREKNQSNLCTSHNLNGDENDYVGTRGFFSDQTKGKDLRMLANKPSCSSSSSTGCQNGPGCTNQQVMRGVTAFCQRTTSPCKTINGPGITLDPKKGRCNDNTNCRCCIPGCRDTTAGSHCATLDKGAFCLSTKDQSECKGTDGKKWVFHPNTDQITYCQNKQCGCCAPPSLYNPCMPIDTLFKTKHVCDTCTDGSDAKKTGARYFSRTHRSADSTLFGGRPLPGNTVFSSAQGIIAKASKATWNKKEYVTCKIQVPVKTWYCGIHDVNGERKYWDNCKDKGLCTGEYLADNSLNDLTNGHFLTNTENCQKIN